MRGADDADTKFYIKEHTLKGPIQALTHKNPSQADLLPNGLHSGSVAHPSKMTMVRRPTRFPTNPLVPARHLLCRSPPVHLNLMPKRTPALALAQNDHDKGVVWPPPKGTEWMHAEFMGMVKDPPDRKHEVNGIMVGYKGHVPRSRDKVGGSSFGGIVGARSGEGFPAPEETNPAYMPAYGAQTVHPEGEHPLYVSMAMSHGKSTVMASSGVPLPNGPTRTVEGNGYIPRFAGHKPGAYDQIGGSVYGAHAEGPKVSIPPPPPLPPPPPGGSEFKWQVRRPGKEGSKVRPHVGDLPALNRCSRRASLSTRPSTATTRPRPTVEPPCECREPPMRPPTVTKPPS